MLDKDQIAGLNIALNEATLLGVEVDTGRREAGVTLSVLTLPEQGQPPKDGRILFIFSPIGRIAASLRLGHWSDPLARVVAFDIDLISMFVNGRNLPIYGWEFFDRDDDFEKWKDRLSVDCRLGKDDGMSHSITLFQEGSDRHLDLRIWFDALTLRDCEGRAVELAEIIAGGKRWWDGFRDGDPRTKGSGIYPLK